MSDEKIKMVIVMRKDLNMRKGKMIAMGCHASMKVLLDQMRFDYTNQDYVTRILSINPLSPLNLWLSGLFTKIVVYVNSEAELFKVYTIAVAKGMHCSLIEDAGKTEFNGIPTYTCCAIGPDFEDKINEITGELPLL